MSTPPASDQPALPAFRYHPDPLGTSSIRASDTVCVVCGQARGYVYTGPVYTESTEELDERICPWCIADGAAHERFAAEFTDMGSIGGDDWEEVPERVQKLVGHRTPGFTSWQGERWFTHCGDAAAFLGPVGYKELKALDPAARAAIRDEAALEGAEWQEYYRSLDREGSPVAYLFRCLHCGAYGGYSDMD